MSQPSLGRRLTATDAAFLYAEREDAPMHIGAIAVIDGDLDFAGYGRSIAAKLERLPRFRHKAVAAPFNVGHPTWEDDREFDLARHLFLHQVAAPGGCEELFTAAAAVFTGVLDRSKPLWELHLLRGLEGGRSALVSKIHHAMVDGVGANEIVTTILDIAKSPAPRMMTTTSSSGHAGGENRQSPFDALWANTTATVDAWAKTSLALLEVGRTFTSEQAQVTLQALVETMPDFALPLRRLPFNRPGSKRRKVVGTEFSFAEARAIRGALGGSVNDVVLAALAGGVARYCRKHGMAVAGRTMRVMVPVNVRSSAEARALGNQVSLLPVSVPLDVDDPARRLRTIHGTTRILKAAKVAEGLHQMANLWGTVPPPIQAAFGAIGAWAPAPVFNLVCTNVPGPQIRLYALEHPVIAYYPSVPVGYQMGLGCAIYSYDQRLFIGLTADVAACPDVEVVLACVEEALVELREAAGIASIAVVDTSRPPREASAAAAGTALRPAARRAGGVPQRRGTRTRAPGAARARRDAERDPSS
ncbi:MAG TPA: wax ester/triacylglycerol synthase family O-acyltransferase [Thermoanaerobaculia bacterium]|nr:wax ester/triacylglycerol synthase family O-acyltransferase [Thermoanaerobaculia bacterium]